MKWKIRSVAFESLIRRGRLSNLLKNERILHIY